MKTKKADPRAQLGQRGAKLASLAAPIAAPKKQPAKVPADAAKFLPWLDKHAGPELRAWNKLLQKTRLASTYRGAFSVARGYTFTHAVAGVEDDGCWLARVRALFLGLSPILEEDEELHLVSWFTSDGHNAVWYTHQDEWEIQSPRASIASWFVGRLQNEGERDDAKFELAPELVKAAEKAGRARVKTPPHLDAGKMQSRTDWIVSLFLEIGGDDGLARAPSMKQWQKEKALAKKWPHLQAYWLLHHLVMDNREELAWLVANHEPSYPAARELAGWAKRVLAGKPVVSDVWDDKRILGLRTRALEAKHDLFTAGAKERLRAATSGVREAQAKAKAAKASAKSAKPGGLYELAEQFAGKIPALEQAVNESVNKADEDLKMKVFLWSRRGNATVLRSLLWNMTESVDLSLAPFFEAKVQEGAAFEETHEKNTLGSIACLGVALGDWAALVRSVEEALGELSKLGRLRRLELAVAAQRIVEAGKPADGALEFLRGESTRFCDQLEGWETDTAVTSLAWLMRRKDASALATFGKALERSSYSGANWTTLLALVQMALDEVRDPKLARGLLAALDKGLGRHDDGDRAIVARAYAAVAGAAATKELEKRLGTIKDVRAECERASLAAGLVEASGATHAATAKSALDALLAKNSGSMENGAAIGLLRAVHDKQLAGFANYARDFLARAKADKYTKKAVTAWLAGASFA